MRRILPLLLASALFIAPLASQAQTEQYGTTSTAADDDGHGKWGLLGLLGLLAFLKRNRLGYRDETVRGAH